MDPISHLALLLAALAPTPAPAGATAEAAAWAGTLDRLDVARAVAFARDDLGGLDAVYAPGSGLAEADAAVMRDWRARGVSPGPVRVRASSVRVLERSPSRARLDVVDRLDPLRSVEAPEDGATRRTLVLVRTDAGWRIAASHRVAG